MELPIPNARLTKVEGGGASEDYDSPAGADTQKWTGSDGIYWLEESERVPDGRSTSVIVSRHAIVRAELPVDFAEGDTITVDRILEADTITADVRKVVRRAFPGLPGIVRLVLEDG